MCVIINPGHVLQQVHHNKRKQEGGELDPDILMTSMLFMDSLRSHDANRVKKNVLAWLNYEWNRSEQGKGTMADPFTQTTLPTVAPKG